MKNTMLILLGALVMFAGCKKDDGGGDTPTTVTYIFTYDVTIEGSGTLSKNAIAYMKADGTVDTAFNEVHFTYSFEAPSNNYHAKVMAIGTVETGSVDVSYTLSAANVNTPGEFDMYYEDTATFDAGANYTYGKEISGTSSK